jgi:pimeloyl-ACP methyl ester carboxylesterase
VQDATSSRGILVRYLGWTAAALLALLLGSPASANPIRRYFRLDRVNAQLQGRVLDFTHNHGSDNRIWSETLQQKRDVYVYVPPGFDPCKQYPLMLWLHGHAQDEFVFLRDVIQPLDQAIASGQLPPLIIVAPDGSIRGMDCFLTASSFFLNSEAGRYEDYLMVDVWNFAMSRFPICPARDAHVILGVSLGGAAAFNKAIKYPEYFRHVVGLFPPLNLRWQDCHGRYKGDFDPDCWGWRTDFVHRRTVIARFYGIPIHLRSILNPLYSRRNPETLPAIIRNNVVEMLDLYDVPPGLLEMYVAYGGKDQFNIDAQVESFLFVAHRRGLEVGVGYDPNGKHNRPTAERLLPGIINWLAPRLAPFAPDGAAPTPLIVPGPCGTLVPLAGGSLPLLP